MNRWTDIVVAFFLLSGLATPVHAGALSLADVLGKVFAQNPDLQASALQVDMQHADVMRVDGALDTRYGGSLGISNEAAPTTNPFSPHETNAAFLAGQIVKPFANGSTLTGTLKYNRAELIYPATVNPAFQSKPNPQYQHQIDLIYRYPLAAGAGNPDYTYQKQAGLAGEKAAALQRAVLQEKLAAQAIGLYAQFALSDLSLKLAGDAVLRARQLLRNQKERESFGLVEEADRYQTEALLAARKLQLAQAEADKRAAQTALNRLMYQDADTPLAVRLQAPDIKLKPVQTLVATAKTKRPIFKVLDAQYAAAEARLHMAQAADEYQLDIIGQLGTRALDGSAGQAFTQGFDPTQDRYIGVSIEFSDALGGQASRAAVQKAVLALENIRVEKRKAELDLTTEIATLLDKLRSTKIMLRTSRAQVRAEKKKYQAELARYQKGRTPTAVVIQFEGDLRAAQLRAAMQQVSMGVLRYQLALAIGELPALLAQGDVQ